MSTADTPSEASNPTASALPSPGHVLREARQQRGMTAEQVSAETNLSPRYVEALETDNYAVLPGQAFARGYLRRYAQTLGMDSDALMPAFERLWQAQRPEQGAGGLSGPATKAKTGTASRAPAASGVGESVVQISNKVRSISMAQLLSWGSLALLLLLLAGTFFWQGDDHQDAAQPVDMTAGADAAQTTSTEPPPAEPGATPTSAAAAAPLAPTADPAAAGQAPGTEPGAVTPPAPGATAPATAPNAAVPPAGAVPNAGVTNGAPAAAPTMAPPAQPTAAPAARPAQPVPAATPAAAPASATPAAAASPAPQAVPSSAPRADTLDLSFSGKTWVSVRDATGQELVYGLKSPGQEVSVSGQPPFSINIGNVAAIAMSRNGKPVNLKPYTRGEIASFRLN